MTETTDKAQPVADFSGAREERYHYLFDEAIDMIHFVDGAFRIVDVNEAEVKRLGYSREELIGTSMPALIDPEFRDATKSRMARVSKGELVRSYETALMTKDGQSVQVVAHVVPHMENGTFKGAHAILREVTELLRAAQESRELNDLLNAQVEQRTRDLRDVNAELKRRLDELEVAKRRYDLAVDATSDGVWDWNILTNEEYFAPKWCEIIGFAADDPSFEHTYSSWASRIHQDDREGVEAAIAAHLEHGAPYDVTYRHQHKSGEYRWQNSRGQAVFGEDGKPVRMVGAIRDVTKKKHAELELREAHERLRRAERLTVLGQLSGGVAHELRHPLGAIKNAAYFLNMVLKDPDPRVAETLGILEHEVGRSEQIIASLLDYASPAPPMREKTDVGALLATVLATQPAPPGIRVTPEIDRSLPLVLADRVQLEQVFGNLLVNGFQAMPEGGELTLRAALGPSGEVVVDVADTGGGISAEDAERVFEPLFTTKAKGIGLGLALARLLIEGHGGTVSISERTGGATFRVCLPVSGAQGGLK